MTHVCSASSESIARLRESERELLRSLVRLMRQRQLLDEIPAIERDHLVEFADRMDSLLRRSVEALGGWDRADPWIEARLTHLKRMPYRKYLKTAEWRDTRTIALQQAERRCRLCNSPDELAVHHRTYERRGNEALSDLIVLCRRCHTNFHTSPGSDANQDAGARVLPLPSQEGPRLD